MKNTGNKVMRKVKGLWVAVALIGAVGLSTPLNVANAQSPVEFVLTSNASTKFANKAELVDNELVQTESAKALDAITNKWSQNTLEQVKDEIERQKELGLEAYVVQWGDTLGVIAQAVDVDVQELADANGISDRGLILTGDILNGVLSEVESVEVSPAPEAPAQPSTPAPEAPKPEVNKPVEEKPNTEKPSEEKPTTEEPKPEEPTTEEPTTEEPTTEEPTTEEPTTEEPTTEEPTTEEPKPEEPTTEEPTTEEPTTEETTEEPKPEEPTTEEPTTEDEVVVTEVKETKSIDFKTETRENANLPKGETKVVQEGKAGVETITYKVTKVNGKETKREEIKREVTTQPVNKIVEVGTKVENQEPTVTKTDHTYGNTEIRNEVYNEVNNGSHGVLVSPGGSYQTGRLEFVGETENSYVDANGDTILEVTTNQRGYFTYMPNIYTDNTIEKGTEVVSVQGQEGYTSFGYTDVYKNGVYQTTRYFDNDIVVDATVGTILEGTKDITGTRTWTEFTPIIAGTITTNDPNKPASESYTVAGKDGYIAIHYKSVNGGAKEEVGRAVVDAVYHEVFNGTK